MLERIGGDREPLRPRLVFHAALRGEPSNDLVEPGALSPGPEHLHDLVELVRPAGQRGGQDAAGHVVVGKRPALIDAEDALLLLFDTGRLLEADAQSAQDLVDLPPQRFIGRQPQQQRRERSRLLLEKDDKGRSHLSTAPKGAVVLLDGPTVDHLQSREDRLVLVERLRIGRIDAHHRDAGRGLTVPVEDLRHLAQDSRIQGVAPHHQRDRPFAIELLEQPSRLVAQGIRPRLGRIQPQPQPGPGGEVVRHDGDRNDAQEKAGHVQALERSLHHHLRASSDVIAATSSTRVTDEK